MQWICWGVRNRSCSTCCCVRLQRAPAWVEVGGAAKEGLCTLVGELFLGIRVRFEADFYVYSSCTVA